MKDDNYTELRKRVSEVLYYRWDPIGVSSMPEARGEYESYVPQILDILQKNEGTQKLSTLLAKIRMENMGLPENMTRDISTAQLLEDHKRAVILGLA